MGRIFAHVVAEHRRLEQRLAGAHPVDVAAERVDLAVVRHVAVRVRAIPAREGVGAESRVHQRQRRLHGGMHQVREVLRQLLGEQHALVDERAARQARDVPLLRAVHRRRSNLVVRALADHVELALEGRLIGKRRIAPDERLAHEGFAGERGVAQGGTVGGDRAPAQEGLAFRLHDLLETLFEPPAFHRVARHEHHAAGVFTGLRQDEPGWRQRFLEKGMWHLDQHARAVAGVGLVAAGAAVIQVSQNLQRLLEDGVRLAPLDVGDEAEATGLVLEPGVIEALLCRARAKHGPCVLKTAQDFHSRKIGPSKSLSAGSCKMFGHDLRAAPQGCSSRTCLVREADKDRSRGAAGPDIAALQCLLRTVACRTWCQIAAAA